ncbi:prepilin peptidase [Stackebrandtia soli]|uniref:prepilin peptidase n=1 Tax=Stackebrandtia soli TaxID=1892856 RepID=UPI0039EA53D3
MTLQLLIHFGQHSSSTAAVTGALVVGLGSVPSIQATAHRLSGHSPRPGALATVVCVVLVGLVLAGPDGVVDRARLVALAFGGAVVGAIDVAQRWLPDVIVLPAYPLTGLSLIAQGTFDTDADALLRAALVSASAFAWYGACCAMGGLGFGDVKLAGLLGLVLGWHGWAAGFVALLAATAFGGIAGMRALAGGGRRVAFGPSLMAAAFVAVLVV